MRAIWRHKTVQRAVQVIAITGFALGAYLDWAFALTILALVVVVPLALWFVRGRSEAAFEAVGTFVGVAVIAIGADPTVGGVVIAIVGSAIGSVVVLRWIAPWAANRRRRATETTNDLGTTNES